MSLICEETSNYVNLGVLKLTSNTLEEIREGQKIDLGLVDHLMLVNQGKGSDFNNDENNVIRFKDMVMYLMCQNIKRVF